MLTRPNHFAGTLYKLPVVQAASTISGLQSKWSLLPYDPAIPLLDIHPEKTLTLKDTCTPMFTAALFTIAMTWKQPKCPSTDEWIKKMRYIYTMEYYSAIKQNKIMPFAARWMDLEIIILSEISQSKTNIIWYHLYVESKKKVQMNLFTKQKETHRQENKLMVTKGDSRAGER